MRPADYKTRFFGREKVFSSVLLFSISFYFNVAARERTRNSSRYFFVVFFFFPRKRRICADLWFMASLLEGLCTCRTVDSLQICELGS